MLPDLPKSVPSAVLSAAEAALEETEDIIQRKREARDAYTSSAYRRYAEECRAHVMYDELPAKAQALLDWGDMLQKGLPKTRLHHRFQRSRSTHATCVSIAQVETALAAREGFQGGTLKTELFLTLDPTEGVFRNEDRFNGFLVNGGGVLNTPTGILYALHPEILHRLHAAIAEGQCWRHIEFALNRLVDDFKDR